RSARRACEKSASQERGGLFVFLSATSVFLAEPRAFLRSRAPQLSRERGNFGKHPFSNSPIAGIDLLSEECAWAQWYRLTSTVFARAAKCSCYHESWGYAAPTLEAS